MPHPDKEEISRRIIRKARSFTGVLAGIAEAQALKNAPSYQAHQKSKRPASLSGQKISGKNWPETAKSVLVLALSHPETDLRLDWWDGKDTHGNRILKSIARNLKEWILQNYNAHAEVLPYHLEQGGIFLKDAAVLAGLGVIGKNNLLITPQYGPRVRLKGLIMDIEADPSTLINGYFPCENCDMPCQRACPQKAFTDGSYSRKACLIQMKKDQADAMESSVGFVKYCRICEIFCPMGNR